MRLSFTKKEESQIYKMLQQVTLFSGLERKQITSFADSFFERDFEAGETIEEEGDSGITFYLIVDGSVEVRRGKKLLTKLGRGQWFGEMALIEKAPRSATVIAMGPTKCLAMTSWNFKAALETNPKLALGVMKELARRLRETDKAFSE